MKVNFQTPINSVSFGQVSASLLYNLYKGGELDSLHLFPIGNHIDLSAYSYEDEFKNYIIESIKSTNDNYNFHNPSFKLWHINGSQEGVGKERSLMTFHETSQLTNTEINILNNQDKVYVTSLYTKDVFEAHGLKNVIYQPLWFDDFHYEKKETRPKSYLTFGLYGKLEKRKAHLATIKAWIKAYGWKDDYRLNCCINNPFLVNFPEGTTAEDRKLKLTEATKQIVSDSLKAEGLELPPNINFLNTEEKNTVYNRVLNASDIVLGMSHCEGFDLPLFQSLCLGKKAVVFNAHVHKDYCDERNSVIVSPNGKRILAEDGKFFIRGQQFSQGEWDCWDEDDFISAMKQAETTTLKGRDLTKEFKFKNFLK